MFVLSFLERLIWFSIDGIDVFRQRILEHLRTYRMKSVHSFREKSCIDTIAIMTFEELNWGSTVIQGPVERLPAFSMVLLQVLFFHRALIIESASVRLLLNILK